MRLLIALLFMPITVFAETDPPILGETEVVGLSAYRLLLLVGLAIFFYRIRKPKAQVTKLPSRQANYPDRIAR